VGTGRSRRRRSARPGAIGGLPSRNDRDTGHAKRHLGPLCHGGDGDQHGLECHVRRITANVLDVFAAGPAGATNPSAGNLDRFGIRAGYIEDPPPV